MCGICGVANINSLKPDAESRVRQMADLMSHRGPDGEGFFFEEKVGLGHRRLAILDLSENGKQPMKNKTASLSLVFNGEIYNYGEIKNELASKYEFSGSSDTEVVLYAYAEWGEECVKKFRGMFAFAIFDKEKDVLFFARDHFGQKPFYYFIEKGELVFASELPPLKAVLGRKPKINLAAVGMFFLHNFRHIPDPLTILEGISKLPPASWGKFDLKTGELSIQQYWFPKYKKTKEFSEVDYIKQYLELSRECVALTTIADVPVGILLSGGVDSSTIAALLPHKNLHSFAVGCSKNDPELLRAREVAKKFGTKHHELIIENIEFDEVKNLIASLGEPLNLLSAVFSQRITKIAKQENIKVLIGGNGADEIFYGYDGSNRLLFLSKIFNLLHFPESLKNNLKPKFYLKAFTNFANNFLVPEKYSELKNTGFEKYILKYILKYIHQADSPNYIEKSYYSGLMTENQHSVTIIGDLTGMMNSVEIRTPFLDPKMFEFAAKLPLKYKVGSVFNKLKNKYIMRKAMEKVLPLEIAWGKKMGFGYTFNLAELIRGEWKTQSEFYIFEKALSLGLFKKTEVEKIWQAHQSKEKNYSAILWGFTVLGIWKEKFYE